MSYWIADERINSSVDPHLEKHKFDNRKIVLLPNFVCYNCLLLFVFCFDAQSSMWNSTQAFFWNKFSCFAANSVSFIFDTN
jgi:hypothetical protein